MPELCVGVSGTLLAIGISYSHYLDPMASERWKNDVAYAMTPFKLLSWPIGVWPLQVYNVYSLIRCILATCCMVRNVSVRFRRSLSRDYLKT